MGGHPSAPLFYIPGVLSRPRFYFKVLFFFFVVVLHLFIHAGLCVLFVFVCLLADGTVRIFEQGKKIELSRAIFKTPYALAAYVLNIYTILNSIALQISDISYCSFFPFLISRLSNLADIRRGIV